MKRLLLALVTLPLFATAQKPRIKTDSTVYIAPMQGYENYLAAAFARKHVPLTVVLDKNKADYLLTSTVEQRSPAQPGVVINNGGASSSFERGLESGRADHGKTSASISLVDAESSAVIFAYSVGKQGTAARGATAKYVTSVCSGSTVLAAAGLLEGYRSATHWAYFPVLGAQNIKTARERVVVYRNRISGGGVTAGIDFGLTLLAEVRGGEVAKRTRLLMEYDPQPPPLAVSLLRLVRSHGATLAPLNP